jgi:hypothetical protein
MGTRRAMVRSERHRPVKLLNPPQPSQGPGASQLLLPKQYQTGFDRVYLVDYQQCESIELNTESA